MKKNLRTLLSHVSDQGKARMVNISNKNSSIRTASARGKVFIGEECFHQLRNNQIKKGDVLQVAKLAGIQAAKQTGYVIPLCHNLLLTHISVDLELREAPFSVDIESSVSCDGNTGVEMEALHAVSVAALTVYDMCKAVDKNMVISQIELQMKSGGKQGYDIRD